MEACSFTASANSTRLTDLGHMARPYLQSVYDQSSLVKRLSREFAKKWPLKLGIMSTISPDEIVDLIANIRTRHPEVELKLCDANAKDLRAQLLAGDLEVAIYALPGKEPDERIHSIPLFREQMVLAVHRDHRLAETGAFPVQEMNGEYYIHRVNCEFAGYADVDSRTERSHLQPRLLERARRLDFGYGRRRFGICIHASKLGQTTRRDRSADRPARILATSWPGERERASLFAGGRLAGARSDAEDMVRKRTDSTGALAPWPRRRAPLGFAFMPANSVKHPGVIGLPIVQPEFWREVGLVSVRGRRYSPAVGSLVREAMRKTWFGRRPERVMDSAGALAPVGAGKAA